MKKQSQIPKILLSLLLFTSCSEIAPTNSADDFITTSDSDTSLSGGQKPNKEAPGFIFSIDVGRVTSSCHGTRISRDFIITAAHCFTRSTKASEVTLGRLSADNKMTRFRNLVTQIIIHPDYETRAAEVAKVIKRQDQGQKVFINEAYNHSDIALLKVNPNNLPKFNPNEIEYDSGVKDSGSDQRWIDDLQDYLHSKRIKHFSFWSFLDHPNRYVKNDSSNRNGYLYLENGWSIGFFRDSLVIGEMDANYSICSGDSGGGIFVKNPKNGNGFLLLGTVTHGAAVAPKAQCSEYSTFAMMNPRNVRWINSIIK